MGEEAEERREEARQSEQKALEEIEIVVPDSVKELNLPEQLITNIVLQIKHEEVGEKVKKAKAEILKASKIQVNTDEIEKLCLDYKNTYRHLRFKEFLKRRIS